MNLIARIVFIATMLHGVIVFADPAQDKLNRFISDLDSMRANFVQTVIDNDGNIVDQSEGAMALLRPGRFRWDYSLPFEQQIVTNGKRLWIYEPDLDQVTIKPFESGVGQTPALLLSGDAEVFKRFDISPIDISGSEYDWLLLQPRDEESGYESIQIVFDQDLLKIVRFSDDFGHHTQLEFADIEANTVLVETEFEFVVPPGIEIINDTGQL